MITIIISQHSIYNVYVLIISHSFHSCKVGSLPEASVVEVLSISPRSEESPPGVRSAFSCLHPRNQAPFFGTVTLRISFFGGGAWCGCGGVKFMIFFFMAEVWCSIFVQEIHAIKDWTFIWENLWNKSGLRGFLKYFDLQSCYILKKTAKVW